MSVWFQVLSGHPGVTMPTPGAPGPFALHDPDRLAGILTAAGLEAVEVSEVEAPMRDRSFEEWWERTSALAGPLARALATLPPAQVQELRGRVQEAVRPFRTPDGLEFPGVSLLASAQRPW
jgi:hypothetical protein